PRRVDGLGRDRVLGRADRAGGRVRRRERLLAHGSRLVGVSRLLRRSRTDLPRGRGGRRPAVPPRVEGVVVDRARLLRRTVRRRRSLAYYGLGWNHRQAEIAGIALSTTSLAVVYAVLVETGLNQALVGKRIMSATFVTDLGTVTALMILFITPTVWILPFVLVPIALIPGLPRLPG